MSATIEEHRLGETPWLVVTGERTSAFRLLGEHQSRGIHAIASDSVVDLSTASVTIAPRNQAAASIPANDLANGRAERQSLHAQQPKGKT